MLAYIVHKQHKDHSCHYHHQLTSLQKIIIEILTHKNESLECSFVALTLNINNLFFYRPKHYCRNTIEKKHYMHFSSLIAHQGIKGSPV